MPAPTLDYWRSLAGALPDAVKYWAAESALTPKHLGQLVAGVGTIGANPAWFGQGLQAAESFGDWYSENVPGARGLDAASASAYEVAREAGWPRGALFFGEIGFPDPLDAIRVAAVLPGLVTGFKKAKPNEYLDAVAKLPEDRKLQLSEQTPETLKGKQVFLNEDKTAGYILDQKKDFQGVFNQPGNPPEVAEALKADALNRGAKTGDFTGDFLRSYYQGSGWRVRPGTEQAFNPAYAKPGFEARWGPQSYMEMDAPPDFMRRRILEQFASPMRQQITEYAPSDLGLREAILREANEPGSVFFRTPNVAEGYGLQYPLERPRVRMGSGPQGMATRARRQALGERIVEAAPRLDAAYEASPEAARAWYPEFARGLREHMQSAGGLSAAQAEELVPGYAARIGLTSTNSPVDPNVRKTLFDLSLAARGEQLPHSIPKKLRSGMDIPLEDWWVRAGVDPIEARGPLPLRGGGFFAGDYERGIRRIREAEAPLETLGVVSKGGQKTPSFAQNVAGNLTPGTVDTVMRQILDPTGPKSINSRDYRLFELAMEHAAARRGVPTSSLQSGAWVGAGPSYKGYAPEMIGDSLMDRWLAVIEENARKYGMTPDELAGALYRQDPKVPRIY